MDYTIHTRYSTLILILFLILMLNFVIALQGFTEEEGRERAEKIFETLDKNGDGSLAEDEFIKVKY